MSPCNELFGFEPDIFLNPANALDLEVNDYVKEIPWHKHRKGQLILALHGAVTCKVANSWWIAPPTSGVWIPGGVMHSNTATNNARLLFLFIEPSAAELPSYPCTLSISPMVKEMTIELAASSNNQYDENARLQRITSLLLDEIVLMPQEELNFPVPDNPKIGIIAQTLTEHPDDRRTIAEWASHVALSERSLTRLMREETGLTFGQWRKQLLLMIALRELASGTPVQQIAETLGYESVTAFITMFKKAYGHTPTQYMATRLKT